LVNFFYEPHKNIYPFCRAMHCNAKRGIATASVTFTIPA